MTGIKKVKTYYVRLRHVL